MITTGGEGKVPPRKRMRGKIGNPSSAPELKTHNLLVEGTDTNATFYNQILTKGVFTNAASGVWYPYVCNWPTVGTSAHQRIGNKIRVKLLRLKGYVAYSPYLITQVRYRIVLYRTTKFLNYTHTQFIVPMYNAFLDIHNVASVDGKQAACTTNYYMSFFNKEYMQQHDIKRRVLFRGIIKPQVDIGNFHFYPLTLTGNFAPGSEPLTITSNSVGAHFGKIFHEVTQGGGIYESTQYFNNDVATGATNNVALATTTAIRNIPFTITQPAFTIYGEFEKHYEVQGQTAAYNATTPGNQRGFFPIDITVSMNDNIDCEKYRYVIVLESDWCIGQASDGGFSNAEDRSNFFISYIPHIYYTDD